MTIQVLEILKDCASALTGGSALLDSVRNKYIFASRFDERKSLLKKMFQEHSRILGGKSAGNLTEGDDADIVVYSEYPLYPTSRVTRVLVNGKQLYSE